MKFLVVLLFGIVSLAALGQDTLLAAPQINIERSKPEQLLIHMCDTEAEFPGGHSELKKYISSKLSTADFSGIDSRSVHTFYIQFVVNEDGSLTDVQTHKLNDSAAIHEIEQLCFSMPKWIASDYGKGSVRTLIIIPITLTLGDPRYPG